MATLREYFDTDFTHTLNVSRTLELRSGSVELTKVDSRLHYDFNANSKYVSYYIPQISDPYSILTVLVDNINEVLDISTTTEVKMGLPGEQHMDSRDLLFSGRIFVYSENDIEDYKLQELEKQISAAKWRIQYRGPRFAEERSKTEKPLAFISHDSRDKDAVARPIAERLRRLMCPVWFDEYSLRVGDSLRESIETGIRECSRCILIISPNFLSNSGWTKSEFDSFFTRELLEEKKLILPVWYKVTKQDIFNYSTSLPDRVGLNWETIGADETIRRLYRALTSPGK